MRAVLTVGLFLILTKSGELHREINAAAANSQTPPCFYRSDSKARSKGEWGRENRTESHHSVPSPGMKRSDSPLTWEGTCLDVWYVTQMMDGLKILTDNRIYNTITSSWWIGVKRCLWLCLVGRWIRHRVAAWDVDVDNERLKRD